MYIMLGKVYYSSFLTFTACTFDWLIDDRSLVNPKLNYVINNVCFRVRSITKIAQILVQNTEMTVWKYIVKSAVHGTWNMEIQYQFADAKIDWLMWWCSFRFTHYCTLNSSYGKKQYIYIYVFCLIVLQTLISVIKSAWLAFKICWRRVTPNFLCG